MTDSVDLQRGPWERWSWVMAAVWLVFLAFPLIAVVTADLAVPLRALGVVGIAAFAALYAAAFIVMGGQTREAILRWSPWWFLALVLIAVVVIALGGTSALGMVIFLVTFSIFALPRAVSALVTLTALAVVVLVPLALGELEDAWPLGPILVLVAAVCLLVTVIDRRQDAHRMLADQVTIVAERERVARDVHDVLGHSLTVVTVKAELAERLVDRDPARAKHEMAQVQSLAREAQAEVRATVAGLRIARLGDELTAARTMLADAGIAADVPDDPSVVDPRHRLVLAWVLREAVTNVVRHSGAQRCDIRLTSAGLAVVDDGRGGAGTRGHGLRGAAERVHAAGGVLDVLDGPDGVGTRVEAWWT